MTDQDKETFDDVFEDLKHYGVLGMKWGVRKDRKPQGYGNPGYDGPKPKKSADRVKADRTAKKSAASLSNEELQSHANRRRLESEFNKLTAAPPSTGQKLRDETKKVLANVARTQVSYAANQVSRKYVDQLLLSVGVEPGDKKKKIKHSDTDSKFKIKFERDAGGRITDIKNEDEFVEYLAKSDSGNEVEHMIRIFGDLTMDDI